MSVSYTHLDVYKRQEMACSTGKHDETRPVESYELSGLKAGKTDIFCPMYADYDSCRAYLEKDLSLIHI